MFGSRDIMNIRIDSRKAKDTGLAATLIFLIAGIWSQNEIYYRIALFVLIADMIYPRLFYPLAYIWFGFAQFAGTVVSKILLLLVYTIMVLPTGIIRQMLGKDTMQLKKWKKGDTSVFRTRNQLFTAADIEKPY